MFILTEDADGRANANANANANAGDVTRPDGSLVGTLPGVLVFDVTSTLGTSFVVAMPASAARRDQPTRRGRGGYRPRRGAQQKRHDASRAQRDLAAGDGADRRRRAFPLRPWRSKRWRRACTRSRLNPGNINDRKQVEEVIAACKSAQGAGGIPIRIGVNEGSIVERKDKQKRLKELGGVFSDNKHGHFLAIMIAKLEEYLDIFYDNDFYDVISPPSRPTRSW